MKRKSAWLSFAACALMAAHPAKAASEKTVGAVSAGAHPIDFSKVEVMTLKDSNGIGFFDRRTGRLYIYDSSLSKCITIKQLNTLGEPARTIQG